MPRVRIVQLDAATLAALAAGDRAAADRTSPAPLSDWLAGQECRGIWAMRATQVVEHPEDAAWVTGVVLDAGSGTPVGRGGFHEAPHDDGTVEVGYAIDPAHRRRGYARASLEAMLERAAAEPAVRTVRASISPDNAPSLALVAQYGFVEVGEQWDDEDGLELVLERPARGA